MSKKLIMQSCYIFILIFSACSSSSSTDKGAIPVGTYQAEEERLIVNASEIYLHIKYDAVKSMAGDYIDKAYSYEVDKDNKEIYLSISSNDFAIIEFNSYQWYWRGGDIERVSGENKKITRFAIKDKVLN